MKDKKKKSAGPSSASNGGSGSKKGKSSTPEPPAELSPAEIKAANRAKAAAGRAIVASSSSWTGKLPATLLYEHCQKLKWEKVNFDAVSGS
ncbi:putative helicase [Sugiyamaella lignohabitans]|uniref:Putative helicase n=1 Tax=Sugiyamaella lignohabitans TaxID=796027 RepID=A0A161HIU8_9ASCO|nr:putative helicase [Sugiyamaella lignohabitans]ANB12517.1 putative helicase [Sugiyamaella lignohabitans]